MLIIGVTGTNGGGKGTIVDYLISKGFTHFSVRNFLTDELKRRGLPIDRPHMRLVGDELRKTKSLSYIIEELLKEARKAGGNAVIESIRNVGEIEMLRKQDNFKLFAADADPKIRYERITARKSSTDNVSYEKFIEQEQNESNPDNPWNMNLPECIRQSDYVFINNGKQEEFYAQIEKVLEKIST